MNEKIIKIARQTVGLYIRDLRKDRGLTQEQVAEAIGVTHATVNKIEQGKFNYGIDLFLKLSIVLGFRFELQAKDEAEDIGRFDLFQDGQEVVILDNKYGIRFLFVAGRFNETQEVKINEDVKVSPGELSTAMREIGDWVLMNYPELI